MSDTGQKCHRHGDRCYCQAPPFLKIACLLFICYINHSQQTDQRQYHECHPDINPIVCAGSVAVDGRIGSWRRAAGPRRRCSRCGFFSWHYKCVIGNKVLIKSLESTLKKLCESFVIFCRQREPGTGSRVADQEQINKDLLLE